MTAVLKIYYSVREFHRMFNGYCLLGGVEGGNSVKQVTMLQGF